MSVPSFPDIARYFNVIEGIIQLTISYNFLGFFIGGFLNGPLSECYGRRKIMLAGNALMLLGAIGCVFAPTINSLLIARFIQGIGASTSIVLVFAIIADIYEGLQAMRLISFINGSLASLMAIAPIIGGFVNEFVGWRGNYMIVAFISLISWSLQFFFLPETRKTLELFNANNIVKNYKMLCSSKQFLKQAVTPSLLFASYMSYIAASAFLYQEAFLVKALSFVLHQAFIVASFAIVSMIVGKVISLLGKKTTVKLGISFCCLSAILMIIGGIGKIYNPFLMTSLMCLFTVGFAICYPVIFSESLSIFPALNGTASSLIMSLRALLVAAFTATTGYIYDNSLIMVALPIASGVFLATFLVNDARKEKTVAS